MLQHQLSKMEIDFALEPERWKSYSASALPSVFPRYWQLLRTSSPRSGAETVPHFYLASLCYFFVLRTLSFTLSSRNPIDEFPKKEKLFRNYLLKSVTHLGAITVISFFVRDRMVMFFV
jgi:hypothetical protein